MINLHELLQSIRKKPVIAALRSLQLLDAALSSSVSTVFYLNADITQLSLLADKARSCGKNSFFHLEFIDGLGRDRSAVRYLAQTVKPDGIITTRANSVRDAREEGVMTIQRCFLVDSQSYDTAVKSIEVSKPDIIELMPGIMPQIISRLVSDTKIPVIAGGLITTKDEAFMAMQAGAFAVSTGAQNLWNMVK